MTNCRAFERSSKRRKGFPSETEVKRGERVVHGDKELVEKLGRNDLCPCGSGRCFQDLLPEDGKVRWDPQGALFSGSRSGSGIFQPAGILALIQAIQVRILVPEPNEHEPRSAAPASGAGDGGCESHVLDHGGGRQGVSGALYAPARLVRFQHPRPASLSSTAEHPPDMRKTSVRLAQGRPTRP